MNGSWQPGWHWIWCIAFLLLFVLPLITRFRLGYAAAWSVVLIAFLVFLWVRNIGGYEGATFDFARYTPAVAFHRSISLWSSVDVIGIGYHSTARSKDLS